MDCVLGLAFPCFYRKLHSFFSRVLGGRGAEASAEEHGADSGPGSGLPPEAPRATLEHAHSFSGGRTSYITPHTHSRQPRQCCHGRRRRAHVPELLSLQVVSCTQLAEADASRAGRSEAPPPVGLARAALYHLRHLFCL